MEPIESNSLMTIGDNDVDHQRPVEIKRQGNGRSRLGYVTRHGRRYMLKGLPEGTGSNAHREMLRKEFHLQEKLDHPGIARAFAMGSNAWWGDVIVMEYIDGTTLGGWLEGNPSAEARVKVAIEIADALAYAHSEGVIHRDIKPDNVMVTKRRTSVKLIDFGLGDSDEYAIMKQSRGTVTYGAPEQQAEGGEVTDRADVYSFGRILETMELPRRYRRLIRRCERRWPDARPSMDEVAAEMRRTEARHRRMPLILMGAVTMASVAVAIYSMTGERSEPEPDKIEEAVREISLDEPVADEGAGELSVAGQNSRRAETAAPAVRADEHPPTEKGGSQDDGGSELLGATLGSHDYDRIFDEQMETAKSRDAEYERIIKSGDPERDGVWLVSDRQKLIRELAADLKKKILAAGASYREAAQIESAFWLEVSNWGMVLINEAEVLRKQREEAAQAE